MRLFMFAAASLILASASDDGTGGCGDYAGASCPKHNEDHCACVLDMGGHPQIVCSGDYKPAG